MRYAYEYENNSNANAYIRIEYLHINSSKCSYYKNMCIVWRLHRMPIYVYAGD